MYNNNTFNSIFSTLSSNYQPNNLKNSSLEFFITNNQTNLLNHLYLNNLIQKSYHSYNQNYLHTQTPNLYQFYNTFFSIQKSLKLSNKTFKNFQLSILLQNPKLIKKYQYKKFIKFYNLINPYLNNLFTKVYK